MKIKAARNVLLVVGIITFIINLIAVPVVTADVQPYIYVNTNGWWRDGGVFNTNSSTPIQAAVDDAIESDHVFVYNGTYTENVVVNKQITLQGEGVDKVSVTAKAHDHVFKIIADRVDISGFTIIGAMKKKTLVWIIPAVLWIIALFPITTS
jgi:pectin methylesterase-like acyl-CoA thioesterase